MFRREIVKEDMLGNALVIAMEAIPIAGVLQMPRIVFHCGRSRESTGNDARVPGPAGCVRIGQAPRERCSLTCHVASRIMVPALPTGWARDRK